MRALHEVRMEFYDSYAEIWVEQLQLKFYIFMHARCRFILVFQLVSVHVFNW